MLRIALASVRTRKTALAGTLAAVTVTVALVTAWLGLLFAGRAATPSADRFGAAAVVVEPDHDFQSTDGGNVTRLPLDRPIGLPAALVADLRGVEGVRDVLADTPFPARIADRPVHAAPDVAAFSGHPWSAAALTPFRLSDGRPPEADGEVVVDAATARAFGLRPGASTRVVTREGTSEFRVVGIAAPETPGLSGGGLPSRSVLFVSDPVAARLAGTPGRVAHIGVLARPGTSAESLVARFRSALDRPGTGVSVRSADTAADGGAAQVHARLLTGDAKSRAGAPEVGGPLADATLLFGLMGGVGAFLSVFAISGAFGLALLGRAREFALLRAVGATAWQIRRMVSAEALTVALVAAVPGCLLGVLVAHGLRELLVTHADVPAELVVTVGPGACAAGAGAGVLLALTASLTASRYATRVRAADALREAEAPSRLVTWPRVVGALLAFAAATALFVLAQHLGGEVGVAFQTLVLLLLLVAALLLAAPLTRVLEPPVGGLVALLGGATGHLAHVNSRAAIRRVAGASAAVLLSVAMAGEVVLVGAVLGDVTGRQARERTVADRVLTPADASVGLPPELRGAVRDMPGAAAVSATRHGTVVSRVLGTPDVLPAAAVDPVAADRVLDLGVRSGSLAALAGPGTVAVSRTHAGEHGWHVGSRITVTLGDGTTARLTVVAVFDRALGFADFVFAAPALAGRTAADLDDAVFVRAAPGRQAELDAALAAYAEAHPTVRVRTGGEFAADAETALARNATGSYLVLGVLVVFTALSLVNTLVVGTADRAREFALLRLAGASRRQVAATVLLETAVAAGIGTILGTAIACVTLAGAQGALTGTVALDLPLGDYAAILGGAAGLSLLASAIPVALTLRSRPLAALAGR
ncbi:FtsX-like permease family protein [Yinghuangia sp. YIM S09857]|uniref:FtsX-like permease family protein n=1 Tax=Yinghuangia sp. YIM S09857 TaxID=3436929 RepID=UPI003F535F9E